MQAAGRRRGTERAEAALAKSSKSCYHVQRISPKRKEATAVVIHESAEDYLESILILHQRRGVVRSIDIVNELGYSKPSVSIAMKKLRESGYITMAADGAITLNESGLEIANRVYSRHKTITRLFELLGVSPEQAAADACKVEHDLSDETFECIRAFVAQRDAAEKG